MSENYLKPKRKARLINDIIKDQVFAWNKYVKLLFGGQLSGKSFQCALIFDFVSDSKYF